MINIPETSSATSNKNFITLSNDNTGSLEMKTDLGTNFTLASTSDYSNVALLPHEQWYDYHMFTAPNLYHGIRLYTINGATISRTPEEAGLFGAFDINSKGNVLRTGSAFVSSSVVFKPGAALVVSGFIPNLATGYGAGGGELYFGFMDYTMMSTAASTTNFSGLLIYGADSEVFNKYAGYTGPTGHAGKFTNAVNVPFEFRMHYDEASGNVLFNYWENGVLKLNTYLASEIPDGKVLYPGVLVIYDLNEATVRTLAQIDYIGCGNIKGYRRKFGQNIDNNVTDF